MTDQTTAPAGVVSSTELGTTASIRVYRLDDYDWWAGESLSACLKEARAQCGDDCYPDDPSIQHELSDQTMQVMKFTDEDGEKRSFAEELNRRIAAGEEFPQMFASTEF